MAGAAPVIPRFRFSDSAGVPLANGTVTTYLAGTTTPTSTWQDSALSTLNTNPVALDANGECVMWLDLAVTYKFLLKNAAGVTQWTVDNIYGATAGGSADYVDDYTALRAYAGNSTTIYVRGDNIAGYFILDADDTTTADDGTTVIVASNGDRWKRAYSGYTEVSWANVTGDGTDETTEFQAAMSASPSYIDLRGKTVETTLGATDVTKNVFNGELIYQNDGGNQGHYKNVSPLEDTEIQRPRTKSPILDWDGKRVLWLGTSIPIEGAGTDDSYPQLFGNTLHCTVDNLAWAGSSATYDVSADAFTIGTVKGLSMTEDDRLAGLALYGPTSAYDDSFDAITKASQMTADYRIKTQFEANPYDCVFLDHNHNDRRSIAGTLTPPTTAITAITKGSTTVITAAGHGRSVGDAVALEIAGIDSLNYAAARVQAVAGDTITLNIDSSAYTGTFTSGTLVYLDRSTTFGAWDFLIYYIKNCAVLFGNADCKIVLSGAPNEYTGGAGDTPHDVYSNAKDLKALATKWGLSFFDIGYEYDIKSHDKLVYFPDGTHPTTTASRQALANHWIEWASGGAGKTVDETQFIPAGTDRVYTEQREALYSKWIGGFGTPDFIIGSETSLDTENFEGGLGAWTTTGTVPTTPAAPWDAGTKALFCESTSAAPITGIYQALAYGDGRYLEFDLYFPAVTGLTTSGLKTVVLARMGTGAGPGTGQYYSLQAIVRASSVQLRWATIPVVAGDITYTGATGIDLEAETVYNIRVEMVQGTANYTGAVLLYIDDVLVNSTYEIDDQSRSNPAYLALGVLSSNTGADLDVYFDNVATGNLAVGDYTARANGTFTTSDAKTATVVNGIIVSLV